MKISLRTELVDFQEKCKRIHEALGWGNTGNFVVEYDGPKVRLIFDNYYRDISEVAINKIREQLPDAEEINYFPPEDGEKGQVYVVLYDDRRTS